MSDLIERAKAILRADIEAAKAAAGRPYAVQRSLDRVIRRSSAAPARAVVTLTTELAVSALLVVAGRRLWGRGR